MVRRWLVGGCITIHHADPAPSSSATTSTLNGNKTRPIMRFAPGDMTVTS
jgi:hypothetical protein